VLLGRCCAGHGCFESVTNHGSEGVEREKDEADDALKERKGDCGVLQCAV
jgi:hypothetical protein